MLLILIDVPALILPPLVSSPFPALAAVIFVSVIGFAMILVIIILSAYKLISKRRERRRTMDLPMQVLGIKDENSDPVLVALGESPRPREKR